MGNGFFIPRYELPPKNLFEYFTLFRQSNEENFSDPMGRRNNHREERQRMSQNFEQTLTNISLVIAYRDD